MYWKPRDVREPIKLTPAEVKAIQARMDGQPRTDDGKYPADAVFQGGGVWATAFLGAVRCCEDAGVTWVGLGGTSAGAVTAGLLAAGYTATDLEGVFDSKKYSDFLSEKTYTGFDSNPANDLTDVKELGALLASLATYKELGRYRTRHFRDWYHELLRHNGAETFGGLFRSVGTVKDAAGRVRHLPRQLRVVAADLSNRRMRVLPDTFLDAKAPPLDPNLTRLGGDLAKASVAEAVRCSVSIPAFFEPARLPPGKKDGDVLVDGGILSNFPLWLFDDAPGKVPGWPTFGFRLVDRPAGRQAINSIADLVGAMFNTMMSASDLYYVSKAGGNRVADIDLKKLLKERPKLTATAFKLSGDDQAALYRVGYLAAKEFLLRQWDWKTHVRARLAVDTALAAAVAIDP